MTSPSVNRGFLRFPGIRITNANLTAANLTRNDGKQIYLDLNPNASHLKPGFVLGRAFLPPKKRT